MSLLSWNCRGSGGSLRSCKMKHLARLMSSTHAQVTFISETRNSRITANELNNHFLISDSFVVPVMRLAFLVAFGRRGLIGLSGGSLSGSHYYVLACVVQKSNVSSFNLVCVCTVIPITSRLIPFEMMSFLLLYKTRADQLYVSGILTILCILMKNGGRALLVYLGLTIFALL